MEFRILGPLEVLDDNGPLSVKGARLRALLAVLLLHSNEVLSSDRLLDEVWGEEPPRSGAIALRMRIAELRKKLGADRLETRSPGYALRVASDELDLWRFERLVDAAAEAEPAEALALLDDALALWRGPALANVEHESFAEASVARLEELRLVARERRAAALVAVGRPEDAVEELRTLVAEHPYREQLRADLMLALYKAGRQAEALAAFQDARRMLVDELGIDPGPALQELERAILRQDPALASEMPAAGPAQTVLIVSSTEPGLDTLVALSAPLATDDGRELMLVRTVEPGELTGESERLASRRESLISAGAAARTAAFASHDPGRDLARLASEQDADLILYEGEMTPEVVALLEAASSDVALLPAARAADTLGPDRPVLVPFTGADHDWAGVELAAWLARASKAPLVLAGRASEGSDASRLLASASLIVQRAVGINTSPLLVEPNAEGLTAAAEGMGLVVFGLPPDWRRRGVGEVRLAVAQGTSVPTLLVRKGLRPGGLAPASSHTRFTWTVQDA